MPYPYAYGSSASNGGGGSGASYGGLGTIGAYGVDQYGNPSAGPYASLNQLSGLGYGYNGGQRPSTGSPGGGVVGGASGTSYGNPADNAATSFLHSVISGDKLPYGQEQQAALFSQSSAQNAAAEAQQNQASQDAAVQGGASATDPSLQSQYRQNAARRQTGNQRALGDIQSQAGSANFAAQGQAAGALLHHGEIMDANSQQASQFNQSMNAAQAAQAQNMLSNYYGGQGGKQGLYNPNKGWGF